MAYTPVPAVSAGDWIDEVFINTYWVDNFAAGVPDVFTNKGQLVVGLGVDNLGVLNVGNNGQILMANSNEVTGLGWVHMPNLSRFVNTSYDGDAISVGNTIVNISSWGITNPMPPIRAIVVKISTKWATASDGSTLDLRSEPGVSYLTVRSEVSNFFNDAQGVVPVNSSGQFRVVVSGAGTTATYIEILGWFQ